MSEIEKIGGWNAVVQNPDRFNAAVALIDRANDEDPNRIERDGESLGYELYFSRELCNWLVKLKPDASEALMLAARGQHICRWTSPRSDYPDGRVGYLKWRADLKVFHANKTGELLERTGYDAEFVERVKELNQKKNLSKDLECQALEDALCLVFLEKQFAAFSHKTDREKMITILRRTWKKMSEQAHEAALGLPLGEEELELVKEALA